MRKFVSSMLQHTSTTQRRNGFVKPLMSTSKSLLNPTFNLTGDQP